ncbi:MAG: D-alanyl-D-alanine carboxypeptidase/D-alanyl-D-alanine-endopeptidase [Simkaniaceae bacterium]|nr:MAG: D-alanyl-D-alanine carboxypeptidase/D-alanyl-D-alanine-endopeptidase [Simkaniaceae bacterium]
MRVLICFMVCLMGSLGALTLEERKGLIHEGVEGLIQSVDPTALVGAMVYSFDENIELYERNSESRFVPASSLKLFTAAAALECLGEGDSFETRVMTDGNVEQGVLKGNCYLVGSGDPSLIGLDLLEIIDQLGDLERIEGDLVLDLSCFEDGPMGPGWMWDEEPAYWCVPMSALNIEHNCIDDVAILEPEKLTAAMFKGILDRKGIVLKGELREGMAPEEGVVLARHLSEPMSELIKPILKNTDNLYADCVFKKMGPSWEKGQEKVLNFLSEKIEIDSGTLRVVDGCGLSRYNLVSPKQMITFLKKMKGNRSFVSALPIGGVDGTLKNRMKMFEGKVRAKTGSMTGVSSLCGYLKTDSGRELAIAIFVNGYVKEGREIKKKLEDGICQMLVNMQDE